MTRRSLGSAGFLFLGEARHAPAQVGVQFQRRTGFLPAQEHGSIQDQPPPSARKIAIWSCTSCTRAAAADASALASERCASSRDRKSPRPKRNSLPACAAEIGRASWRERGCQYV